MISAVDLGTNGIGSLGVPKTVQQGWPDSLPLYSTAQYGRCPAEADWARMAHVRYLDQERHRLDQQTNHPYENQIFIEIWLADSQSMPSALRLYCDAGTS